MGNSVYYKVVIQNPVSSTEVLNALVCAKNIKEVYEILIQEDPNVVILSVKLIDYDLFLQKTE